MTRKTACLFGGTLVSAGLASTHAEAQSFQNTGGVAANAYAYSYDPYVYVSSSSNGFNTDPAGSGSISLDDGSTASWSWDAPAGRWDIALDRTGNGIETTANLVSIFNVADNYTLTISWDFTNADLSTPFTSEFTWSLFESEDASFTPDERIDAVFADNLDLGTPSSLIGLVGSTTIQLDAGMTYQLALDLFADSSSALAQSGFVSVALGPVPSPGALLMLGAGGCLAARRRR